MKRTSKLVPVVIESRNKAHGSATDVDIDYWAVLQRLLQWTSTGLRIAKPWCVKCVDLPFFQFFMFVFTIYALIGDDIRLAGFTKEADVWFNILTFLALALFSIELVLNCIARDDYLWSFFLLAGLNSHAFAPLGHHLDLQRDV